MVDDAVEGAGERLHVGRLEEPARVPAAGEPAEDVMRDPVALLLAQEDVAREPRLLGKSRSRSRSSSVVRCTLRADSSSRASNSGSGLRLAGHMGRP